MPKPCNKLIVSLRFSGVNRVMPRRPPLATRSDIDLVALIALSEEL
jgi:hypothetical protein